LLRFGESAAEMRRRDLINRVRTPVAGGHHRVAVLSLKGGVVWLGTAVLPLSIEGFAAINAVSVCLWIFICFQIAREHRKKRAALPKEPLPG
ncbi:MAG: hypothetical protein ACYDH3_02455, partial [Candidatus Aminicenantales bacterium]